MVLPDDVLEVIVSHVLDDDDWVRVFILHQYFLEPWRAGRQNGLVRLDRLPVSRQRHVAERLSGQELVERLRQLLGVVDPGQAEVLATTVVAVDGAAAAGDAPDAAVHSAASVGREEREAAAAATERVLDQ